MPYVDASFPVALIAKGDQWRPAARDAAPSVMRRPPWRTPGLALGKVVAVIGSRRGGRAARTAHEMVPDTMDVAVPTLSDMDEAMARVVRPDGALRLSDAPFVDYTVGEDDPMIRSFDSDFDRTGLRRMPGADGCL